MTVFSVMAFTGDSALSPPAAVSTSESSTLQNTARPVPESRKRRTIVAKFGGSSLADSERIAKAAASVARVVAEGGRVAVVVSAMGKTTDTLLEILQNPSGRTIEKHDADDILSMGERTSARVFAATLKSEGVRVRYFDPDDEDWPIITDDNFSDANPILTICEERIRRHVLPLLEEGVVPVIAGFVGRTRDHKISTIGRGGSDTTAFILARALKADEVVLVTDSDGIMTADPKLVPEAKRLESVDVNILVGMADSGKKFIHRKALKYKDPAIDVRVINYSRGNLDSEGTRITGSIASELEVELAAQRQAMALTVVGNALSSNPRIISELTEKVEEHTELLGLSANSNSIILYAVEVERSEEILMRVHNIILGHSQAVSMTVRRGLAYLRVKGVGLEETPGVVGRISETLRVNGINIFGILTITSSIMIFVDHSVKEQAIRLIRDSLGVGLKC
ncbi:MAG: aspartate kinase [Candidatus Bathyarchaeia archaeon]